MGRSQGRPGDLRPLYRAWLLVVQDRPLDEDEPEPPVLAGLNELSGLQRALAVPLGQVGAGRVRNPGREIDVAFTAELSGRQSNAVSAMLAYDDGALVAPPGSGRTVRACAQVIVDECHHLAAGAYEHSVKRIGAQFWLTATPKRRDGLGEIVIWQLRPVRHTVAEKDERRPVQRSPDHDGSSTSTRPPSVAAIFGPRRRAARVDRR